jgi:hypothetical protein
VTVGSEGPRRDFHAVLSSLLVSECMADSSIPSLKLTKEKLLRRMDLGSERNDLIEGLLRKKDELNLDGK